MWDWCSLWEPSAELAFEEASLMEKAVPDEVYHTRMDPLSITAATLACIQAANVAFKLIAGVRDSPAEVEALKQELLELESLVKNIFDTLSSAPQDASLRYARILREPLATIKRDVELLNTYCQKRFKNCHVTAVDRIVWVKERSQLKEFNDRLNRRKLNALLAVAGAGISNSFRIEAAIKDISTTLSTTHGILGAGLHSGGAVVPAPQYISQNVTQNATQTVTQSITHNITQNLTQNLSQNITQHALTAVCSCRCHYRDALETPGWVEILTGRLYYLKSTVTTCTDQKCRLQCFESSLTTSLTWRPPRWSPFQRAVAFRIETTFFMNPVYSLSFPRQVSGGAKIFHCASTGNLEGLKVLLQSGMASPDDQKWNSGSTALHYAVLSERIDMCDFLIKAGCNAWLPTIASVTATDYALTKVLGSRVESSKQKALREIFKLSEVVRARDYSVIHEVVLGLRCDQTLETAILEYPHKINQLDASSRTALSWAVQRGDQTATRLLLKFDADPNIPDAADMTPLHYATFSEDQKCLELLLQRHVNISPRDKDRGWGPLHYATYLHDNPRMVDLLLRHGADVDSPTESFKCSLVLAILKNHSKVVSRLLEEDPDLYIADNSGWTPLNCAIASRSTECLNHLVNAGIDLTQLSWGTESVLHLLAAYPEPGSMRCISKGNLEGVLIDALNKDGKTASDVLREQNPSAEMTEAFHDVLRKVIQDSDVIKVGVVEISVEVDDVYEVDEIFVDAPSIATIILVA